MKKVIVPNGARINLSDTFGDLQEYAHERNLAVYDRLFSSYGISLNNIADTDLLVSGVDTTHVTIFAGKALPSSGEYVTLSTDLTNWEIPTQYLDDAVHTIYLAYSGSNNTLTEVVNGFVYGSNDSSAYTREDSTYSINIDSNPGVSGVVLADFVADNIATVVVTDRRNENILRLNDDLYDWSHTHNSGLDVFAVTPAASELNSLFRSGVINLQDGRGDMFVKMTQIPSKPNTVGTLTGQLYEIAPPTNIGTTLQANLASYNTDKEALGRATAGYTNTNTLRSYIESWRIVHSGAALWHEVWADVDAIDEYGHTISGLATDLVSWGYATNSGLGLTIPAGQDPASFTANGLLTHLGSTLAAQLSLRSDINTGLAATGQMLAAESARIRNNPKAVKSQFRYRVSWDQPTLVDSEAITKYNVYKYKLGNGNWGTNTPTEAEMRTDSNNIAAVRSFVKEQSQEVNNSIVSRSTLEVGAEATTNTVTFLDNPALTTYPSVNDLCNVSGSESDKNVVTSVNTVTKQVTFSKAFTTNPLSAGEFVQFYYTQATTTEAQRSTWLDVDRDENYIIYVQPVTEYGIEGDWSAGHYVETNVLTDGSGNTLLDLTQAQDIMVNTARDAEVATIRQSTEDAVAQLNMTVAGLPTYGNLKSVADAAIGL